MALLLAALSGGASLFTFAPFGWWPLQFLLLAYFFYQVGRSTSVARAAWIGWAFGFGWCVAGMHWLYISIHRFGGVSAPLAAFEQPGQSRRSCLSSSSFLRMMMRRSSSPKCEEIAPPTDASEGRQGVRTTYGMAAQKGRGGNRAW